MASQRRATGRFPAGAFVQQYNARCPGGIDARLLRTRDLRSRKHATVEVSFVQCDGRVDPPTRGAMVVKHFEDGEQDLLRREQAVLSHAAGAGIAVPAVVCVLDNFLVLERVEGRTLMDEVNDEALPIVYRKGVIAGLGEWLSKFHAAFAGSPIARRRGDANLRNFIATQADAIVGLDFEEASLGDPQRDLHEIVDSILQSRPGILSVQIAAIAWKFDLCECLLRSYAAASRKRMNDVIKDPATFIDTQFRIMQELAATRGALDGLLPLVPAIRKELACLVDKVLSG
ncbi:MAG: phosphotransferase [Candidatus Lokiarchaeota archaeon]|nr:phosphotransferase [Candidatus Lokiarchaeota archaeon]